MIELLEKMEASDPGYLNAKLYDALRLINLCTEEEFFNNLFEHFVIQTTWGTSRALLIQLAPRFTQHKPKNAHS
jgi:hypothetical protein